MRAAPVSHQTLGDKLHHLADLEPSDIDTIEEIVDELLTRHRAEQRERTRQLIRLALKGEK